MICFAFLCRKQPKTFAFDHCFFSTDPSAPHFASQDIVFDSVGRDILENAFQGYNACIFAYGQTGKYLMFDDTFRSDLLHDPALFDRKLLENANLLFTTLLTMKLFEARRREHEIRCRHGGIIKGY